MDLPVRSGEPGSPLSAPDSRLRVQEKITAEDLRALCKKEIIALCIPGFLSETECRILSARAQENSACGRYSMAQDLDVFRTGLTLFETQFDRGLYRIYFKEAQMRRRALNDFCAPLANPNETVQAKLKEVWPAGAMAEEVFEKPCGTGTCRIFTNGQRLPPHMDYLPKDVKDYPRELYPVCQLAANVYIQTPPEGGELNCWEISPSMDELAAIQSGVYDFIRDDLLPEPALSLKPLDGDLIFIRAGDIHSVSSFAGGNRMAFSFFINYRGDSLPLRYYV